MKTGQSRYRKRPRLRQLALYKVLALAAVFGLLGTVQAANPGATPEVRHAITCETPYVIDGDTIDCNGQRIRLSGIDAPEMPGHCRASRRCTKGNPHAAKTYLHSLLRGPLTCRAVDTDTYGRTVAQCEAAGQDLSCAMVRAGHAVKRYRPLSCA